MARPRAKLLMLPIFATALCAIAFGTWNALDNAQLLAAVGSSVTTAKRAQGLASFRAEGSLPPCIASYKSGKSTNYTLFGADSHVRFADGAEYTMPGGEPFKFFLNEPPKTSARGRVESAARKQLARIQPNVTEFKSIACLGPDEKVWVEACVMGDSLVGCGGYSGQILITVGGVGARAAYVMSHAHGSIALALLGVIQLLALIVALTRHDRTVITQLARAHGVDGAGRGVLVILGLAVLGAVISLSLWTTTYGPWFLCVFILLIALVALTSAIGRLQVLGSARRVLEGTKTAHLHSEQGLDRELAVRVAEDAPQIQGFRGGERHALINFRIVERYTERRNERTVSATRQVAAAVHPKLVPIEDASGRGVLSLEHCTVDPPLENHENWGPEVTAMPEWGASVIGELPRADKHYGYDVFWSAVSPGEALLIYGGVERVRPSAVGVAHLHSDSGYRMSPDIPVVRGQSDKPAIAYVGTEAALSSGIRVERSSLAIMIALGTVAAAVASVALAWVALT